MFAALPTAASSQGTEYIRQLQTRLSSLETELRNLTGAVERLGFRLERLAERVGALEDGSRSSGPAAAGGGSGSEPLASGRAVPPPSSDAGVLSSGTAIEQYREGHKLLVRGRYGDAERVFGVFLDRFPKDASSDQARYWLAVSQYQQGKHKSAAQQFLAAYEKAPQGPKAPDNLLGLARAFAALGQKKAACTALGRLGREHPRAPGTVTVGAQAKSKELAC